MLIKFKEPDPRAGTTARMDSSRGQDFIDSGAADHVSEQPTEDVPEPVVEAALAAAETTEAADPVSEKPAGKNGRKGKGKV